MQGWVTIRMADPTFKRSPMQRVSSVSPRCLLIAGEIQLPYRHWPIYGVLEDSSLDAHTLPDDITWQSHIHRNDLHRHSPSSSANRARAPTTRGPALTLVCRAYVPSGLTTESSSRSAGLRC